MPSGRARRAPAITMSSQTRCSDDSANVGRGRARMQCTRRAPRVPAARAARCVDLRRARVPAPTKDHAAPSASRARSAASSPSIGGSSTNTATPGRTTRPNPRRSACSSANSAIKRRSRPTSTRKRTRCDSLTRVTPNTPAASWSRGTLAGQASATARNSANSTGRRCSDTLRDCRSAGCADQGHRSPVARSARCARPRPGSAA